MIRSGSNAFTLALLALVSTVFAGCAGGPIPGAPRPTQGIGVMYNYPPADGSAPTKAPGFFLRSPGAITPAGTDIPMPRAYERFLYEAELVIVIGRRARNVSEAEAPAHILGYTVGMDGSPSVTDADGEADLARSLFGKSADGVAPVGSRLVGSLDPEGHDVVLRVNGEEVDRVSTKKLRWGPARLVSELSRLITLEPGDVIYTGAHRPVPRMKVGDVVEVEVEGIDRFSSRVVD